MSAMTSDVHITPRDLGGIPRPVALVICELVNNHGVTYRLQKSNGGHVFLYNGDQQTRPFKISGSRQSEDTMTYLEKWIKQNVPTYGVEPVRQTVTPADVAKLAAVVNTVEHEDKPAEPKVEAVAEEVWKPHKYGFVTNGQIYRYTYADCLYERDDARGLHLHEQIHTGVKAEYSKAGGKAAALAYQQRKIMVSEALRALAEHHGMTLLDGDTPKVDVEGLIAENARLKQEVEDLKARVALITEALRA